MSYNLKLANESLIRKGAYLARSMGYDPEFPPNEHMIEGWREAAMELIQQHKAAHAEIERLRKEIEALKKELVKHESFTQMLHAEKEDLRAENERLRQNVEIQGINLRLREND